MLAVETSDADVLDEVAQAAGERLGREVNVRRVRPAVWDAADTEPFKATVMSRPIVAVIGGDGP